MLRNKIGFFLAGMLNNYNFMIVFSFAYAISMMNPLINPSLVILIEIIPGFITQILYPKYLYQIPYSFRWVLLFVSQLLSSLFLIFFPDKLLFVFTSIVLVSFNSYLGESTMLSLSTFYQKSDLSLWSMGTGISGLLGTGAFLLLNQLMDKRNIFVLNLILYFTGYGLSLLILNPTKSNLEFLQLNKKDEEKEEENGNVGNGNVGNGNKENKEKEEENGNVGNGNVGNPTNEMTTGVSSYFSFFLKIYSICLAYFISYLFGFSYIPLLVQSNQQYQISQFVSRSSMFFGRIAGNYIPIGWLNYFWIFHLYNCICLFVFTLLLLFKIKIPFIVLEISLVLTYFINGSNYPIIYHYIYENYQNEKEKYMGSVGQFTCFFTILGCVVGYPLQILLS